MLGTGGNSIKTPVFSSRAGGEEATPAGPASSSSSVPGSTTSGGHSLFNYINSMNKEQKKFIKHQIKEEAKQKV